MIKVQDWVASIPDGDKHVAYVGEGMSETREFFLCGEDWETYRNWSFHLDMAFDPESITTRESRQVVQTHTNSSQMKEEAAVNTEESVTKETYTVENEEVLNYNLTDIASLEKHVEEDGIRLVWTVLRQHTVLPGKLWATLRAVDSTAQMVKKSAIMVFEVDAAICAVPAARPSISEMEQIEARVALAADNATYCADRAEAALTQSLTNVYLCQTHAEEALKSREWALEHAMKAEDVYNFSVSQVSAAAEHKWAALDAAEQAQACVTQAQEETAKAAQQAAKAEEHRGQASNFAHAASEASNAAGEAVDAANTAAASAAVSAEGAANAVTKCSHYVVQCASYADQAASVMREVENMTYRRINVRDYGAVGDGETDDRAAIVAALDAAKTMLPCEVYFPAGTYGISDGIYVTMPFGSGGLRICGAGRECTTIKYLAGYAELTGTPRWFIFRIWFGMDGNGNAIKPATEEDWMHDISITGLTAYDPNPCANAWHPDKGDNGREETHGFNVYYCKRVSVTDCRFITVGDEAIDLCYCHDAVVMNNHCVGSPAAGTSGAAISIGSGCEGAVVIGNTVNGSAPDETLDDGRILTKANFGIALESLATPVRDVVIADNVIRNIHGNGINIAAVNAGAGLYNVTIANNVVQGCDNGIGDSGKYPKEGVVIANNIFADCTLAKSNFGIGIRLSGGYTNLVIRDNAIRNTNSYGVYMDGAEAFNDVLFDSNILEDIGAQAMFLNAGKYIFRDCIIKNAGIVNGSGQAAVYTYSATDTELYVYGCRLTGVRQKNAIINATDVENTYIEMVDADGNRITNPAVLTGKKLQRLVNCRFDGYFSISQDNAIVQGNTITNGEGWMHALTINANGVIVSGNHITQTDKSKSKLPVAEGTDKNYNLFMGNVCNAAITAIGAQSVAVNNIVKA